MGLLIDHAMNVNVTGKQKRASTKFIEYFDKLDRLWRVSERDTSRDAGAKGDTCLVFSTSDNIRRVWSYPRSWKTLSGSQLETLSETCCNPQTKSDVEIAVSPGVIAPA